MPHKFLHGIVLVHDFNICLAVETFKIRYDDGFSKVSNNAVVNFTHNLCSLILDPIIIGIVLTADWLRSWKLCSRILW